MRIIITIIRAHNGCLRLFDVKDLAEDLARLSVEPEAARARHTHPTYRLQRRAGEPASSPAPTPVAPQARRVLLPALNCEDDDETAARGRNYGYLFYVENTKVQVVRDLRTEADLARAFPTVEERILKEVWSRTRLFAAAATILTSLMNTNHHRGVMPADLRLDDRDIWPPLFDEMSCATSEGTWEHVERLSLEGDEWVLVEDHDDDNDNDGEGMHAAGAGAPAETTRTAPAAKVRLARELVNVGLLSHLSCGRL
jgi:hypothetical protein